MDLIVRQNSSLQWTLEDMLGRSAGRIEIDLTGVYRVVVEGRGVELLGQLSPGPYSSVDTALAEIEHHIRGACMLRYDV
jgi:hypothetical protein